MRSDCAFGDMKGVLDRFMNKHMQFQCFICSAHIIRNLFNIWGHFECQICQIAYGPTGVDISVHILQKDDDCKIEKFVNKALILLVQNSHCIWNGVKKVNGHALCIAKRVISILVNLRYLRFKLLKYKENNKKICNTFDHNFKNIPLYIMSNVSLERYYFVLYNGALTIKMSKMALNAFCDKTLHLFFPNFKCSHSVGGPKMYLAYLLNL